MKEKNMLGADRAQPLISIIMPTYNAKKYIRCGNRFSAFADI